jgi:glutamyl/glutaminyl-tRNA synthetase
MALSRSRRREGADYWPGFVDALSTLVIGIVFLLSVFVLAQFFLSQEITGKDTALRRLENQVAELTDLLALEKTQKRSVEENLDLFQRMRAGEFPNGARSLRAKIDMTAPNMWLRDPLLYRIRHVAHHHAGDKWCIYPLYDYAHCLSDYLEGITHSICTLEFVDHRPLYDWVLESLDLPRALPHQYEFSKLIPGYMIVSKRKLLPLIESRAVDGWCVRLRLTHPFHPSRVAY